jgi:fructoselysine-6-P-deglycase FrlB-like protein
MTTTQRMRPGLVAIEQEMARQPADALVSFSANKAVAQQIARSIAQTGRLTLLGMGGSHWVNRIALFAYRQLGIECSAEVMSEALLAPLPDRPRTLILTSQSGGSGEVARYLARPVRQEQRFGLSLNAGGLLAAQLPTLTGVGGVEQAFAATRSTFVSLALHLAVLAELGFEAGPALAHLRQPLAMDITTALTALAGADVIILSGRNSLQGVAEYGALCLMELGRMPTYAFEGGQLRHGPMELLSERTGIMVLRDAGPGSELAPGLVASCSSAGAPVCVFDLSGAPAIADCVTVSGPACDGIAACFALMPALQTVLVSLAAQRIEDVGVPLRSSKVTTAL